MFGNRKSGSYTAANLNNHLVHCIGGSVTSTPFCTGETKVVILNPYNFYGDLGGHFRTLATSIEAFPVNKKNFNCFFQTLFNFRSAVYEN